ncbi:MarR family transcriptional regulator [Cryptosporangium japonicum]|uniref:MarR family transcriptional regulator n=1 Tax=Cryptosporangium japonicum TaxID=80872 RepID=A0ABN0U2G1_9ACTN
MGVTDHVDRILAQWRRERPDLDVSPMAVIGRLSRAAAAVHGRLDRTFAAHDLDRGSFDVLATLLRNGPPHRLTPAQLAADAMITSAAVAQRLNRLESRGLVTRAPNPDDGRGSLVSLTAAGKAAVEATLPAHLATEQELLADLSPEERETLAALLARVFHSADPN